MRKQHLKHLAGIAVALLTIVDLSLAQRTPRSIEPGSRIEGLTFEHVFGEGAPNSASAVTLSNLRGRVVILEYWATW